MTSSPEVPLYFQVEAVMESARRANTAVTDAEIIWCEGDWRLQQTRKRAEHLAAAATTMKKLFDAEMQRRDGESHPAAKEK